MTVSNDVGMVVLLFVNSDPQASTFPGAFGRHCSGLRSNLFCSVSLVVVLATTRERGQAAKMPRGANKPDIEVKIYDEVPVSGRVSITQGVNRKRHEYKKMKL